MPRSRRRYLLRFLSAPGRLLLVTGLSIFAAEFLVIHVLPELLPVLQESGPALNALFVSVLAIPPLLLFAYWPMLALVRRLEMSEAALRESERRQSALMGNLPGMAYRCQNDREWSMLYVSEGAEALLGIRPESLVNGSIAYNELIYPADRQAVWEQVQAGLAARQPFEMEYRVVTVDGDIRWVWERGRAVVLADDGSEVVEGFITDITDRKMMEEALLRSRDFYLTLFDEFPALIWRAGTDGSCNYFNKAWLAFTGNTLEVELGEGWAEGVHPDDREECVQTYQFAFAARTPFHMEYRLLRHDGQYRWISDYGRPFYDLNSEFAGYVGSCYDITEHRDLEEKLGYLAMHDALTELPNRRFFSEELNRALARARRGVSSALLLMDVDHFKAVNDTVGHQAGDQVLVIMAHAIRECLRESDVLARLGGDEFALLLDSVDAAGALTIAERIRATIEARPCVLCGQQFSLSMSIGLTMVDGAMDGTQLHAQADLALYQAKESGRNQVQRYHSELSTVDA